MSNKPKIKPSKSKADRQNDLSYKLHEVICRTVSDFADKHPREVSIPVALGAINIFRASVYTAQPNRELAQLAREEDDKIVKHLLDMTPTFFFGNRPTDTNLNLN